VTAASTARAPGVEHAVEERSEIDKKWIVGDSRERAERLVDGRRDEAEVTRIALFMQDEDETPGVLQFSLHRHEVELASHGAAPRGVEPTVGRVLIEPSGDERVVERLITVVQECDEVVHARPEQGVLKVDPDEAFRTPSADDHEIPTLIVTMDESAWP